MIQNSFRTMLNALKGQRNLAADAALIEALPHVEEERAPLLLDTLFERGRPHAMRRLVACFATFPPTVQELLARESVRLRGGILDVFSGGSRDEKLSAIELVVRGDRASMSDVLAEGLAGDDPAVKDRCARAIETFASRRAGDAQARHAPFPPGEQPSDLSHIAATLDRAIHLWELHFRPEILTAAMQLAPWTENALRRKIENHRGHFVQALGELVLSTRDARLAPFVWRALGLDVVGTFAIRRLERRQDGEFAAALVSSAWLLKDPRIRTNFRRVRALPWLAGRLEPLARRDARNAFRILELVRCSGMTAARKLDFHRHLLLGDTPALREASLWSLIEDPSEHATQLLGEMRTRAEGHLVEVAQREYNRRRPEEARGSRFRGQPNASRSTPSRPPSAAPTLRSRLASSNPLERLEALAEVRATHVETSVADVISRLVHDAEPAVRATAVARLGALPGATSARLLRAALDDADPRVQANAIEALEQLSPPRFDEWVQPKLTARHPRLRANAVKALISHDAENAGHALLDMLDDGSRASKLSAMWVIGQLQLTPLGERLAFMGRDDADENVRRSANKLLLQLSRADGAHAGEERKVRIA
ncbi:MAG: HEAT repeat domain-containing protein [Phycisphaerales bacterium]|nr:HEAT repeat domain-containing protein [Phycisphaerales bacterium]